MIILLAPNEMLLKDASSLTASGTKFYDIDRITANARSANS